MSGARTAGRGQAAAGAARPRPPIPDLAPLVLVAMLLAVAVLAWAATGDWMRGMDAGPGTDLGPLGFYVVAWILMMAAMMFPSIAPMVLLYARVQRRRQERASGTTVLFASGYLVTWAGFGLAAYVASEVAEWLSVDAFSWERGGPYVSGAVIAAAALYQLTPWKDACLSKCRTPLSFLLERWQEGHRGALRMGVEHGTWCVGCCWTLMAALFALGIMSVAWMALIASLVAVEKIFPWKRLANRGIAALLLALGVAVAFIPEHVPGLAEPPR